MALAPSRQVGGRHTGAPQPAPPWWTGRRFERRTLPWLLLAPATLVILGVVFYPVVRTILLSFTDAGLLRTDEAEWVGLANYQHILADPFLRSTFVRTVAFGLACVVGTMTLGLATALFLNLGFRGRGFLLILCLLPWAMPPVATGIVWKWLFNGELGIVNWALTSIGLDQFDGYSWTVEQIPAFATIGLAVVWQSFPFITVSLLAGLQAIPPDLTDAAKVDGASAWQRLWRVRLPLLRPLIAVLLVISTIWDFRVFDHIIVMTGGGPARATETAAVAIYREAIATRHVDVGSALAVLLFLLLLVISILYIRTVGKEATRT